MHIARLGGRRFVGVAVSLLIATLVTWQTLRNGVPALCHDWRFPADGAALAPFLLDMTSGWVDVGIGEPQPYPTFYHVALLLWLLHFVASPAVVVGAIVAASAMFASLSAYAFARGKHASIPGAISIAILAACNPWVYSKLVAGHVFMVLAYALLVALLAEMHRPRPRRALLIVLATLTIVQIQFFLIVAIPLTIWSARRRLWAVAAAPWIAFLPIAVGIVTEYGAIRATPFTLSWEQGMSVAPLSGLALTGYVFAYARSFDPLAFAAAFLVAIALTGFARLRSAQDRTVVAVAGAAWLVASGTEGWIGPVYRTLAVRFPEAGVYRELYDVIALVAIGYIVLLANALGGRRSFVTSGLALVASLVVAGVWLVDAPANHFSAASALPHPRLPDDPAHRVALLPAFQPLTLDGANSGVDPDAFVRPGQSAPINEPMPKYPVDVALATFEQSGVIAPLRALGVASTIRRPYLRSDRAALDRTALPFAHAAKPGEHALPPASLIGVTAGEPPSVAVGDDVASFGRMFATMSDELTAPTNPASSTDFRNDWVDARLAYHARPEWGTSLGGVATSSRRVLPIEALGMRAMLAQTDGTITDDRDRLLVRKQPRLHWWPLAGDEHGVRCSATCIVVAFSRVVPPLRENGPAMTAAPVPYRRPVPWLAFVDVPAHPGTETLRYLDRYDANWLAIGASATARHLRLVGDVNGWVLPAASNAATITLVHWVSVGQLILELAALLFLAGAMVLALRRPRTTPR